MNLLHQIWCLNFQLYTNTTVKDEGLQPRRKFNEMYSNSKIALERVRMYSLPLKENLQTSQSKASFFYIQAALYSPRPVLFALYHPWYIKLSFLATLKIIFIVSSDYGNRR